MAMQKSYIYFLVSTDKDKFKIGKADNVYSRYTQLKRVWGEFDIKNSFQIECNQKNVFDVEHILHFLLEKYNLSLEQKDGYTEWFDYNCFDDAQSLLSSILGHRDDLKIGKVAIPRKPRNGSNKYILLQDDIVKSLKKQEKRIQKEKKFRKENIKSVGRLNTFLCRKKDFIEDVYIDEHKQLAIDIRLKNPEQLLLYKSERFLDERLDEYKELRQICPTIFHAFGDNNQLSCIASFSVFGSFYFYQNKEICTIHMNLHNIYEHSENYTCAEDALYITKKAIRKAVTYFNPSFIDNNEICQKYLALNPTTQK
jgi:hypothetical protein